jgi:hypothetical protein
MLDFKPTMATPGDWYESSNNDVWTHHAFEIVDTGPDVPPAPPGSGASDELWKLKPSDVVMESVLQLPPGMASFPTVGGIDLPARALQARARHFEDIPMLGDGAPVRDEVADQMTVHDNFVQQLQDLSIRDRILVNEVIADQAPTQTVKTSSIAISFDYCVVRMSRFWLMDAFINQSSWWIPGIPKGQLTESGRAGNVPLMPIGLVVIRNLSIEADWAPEEVESASQATELGPFKVGPEVKAGRLSHPGLQTVGWLLQTMPVVPPNDEPFGL